MDRQGFSPVCDTRPSHIVNRINLYLGPLAQCLEPAKNIIGQTLTIIPRARFYLFFVKAPPFMFHENIGAFFWGDRLPCGKQIQSLFGQWNYSHFTILWLPRLNPSSLGFSGNMQLTFLEINIRPSEIE
jgi:hypothetical protein